MYFKNEFSVEPLLLPIIDLLQQFEDYVKGIALQKMKRKKVIIRGEGI